jgi:hypothetical protein
MSAEERLNILRAAVPNSWIALSNDESKLVAAGGSYAEAVAGAEKCGEQDPVLIKVPKEWLPLVL